MFAYNNLEQNRDIHVSWVELVKVLYWQKKCTCVCWKDINLNLIAPLILWVFPFLICIQSGFFFCILSLFSFLIFYIPLNCYKLILYEENKKNNKIYAAVVVFWLRKWNSMTVYKNSTWMVCFKVNAKDPGERLLENLEWLWWRTLKSNMAVTLRDGWLVSKSLLCEEFS